MPDISFSLVYAVHFAFIWGGGFKINNLKKLIKVKGGFRGLPLLFLIRRLK